MGFFIDILAGIGMIVHYVLFIYMWVVIIAAVITWVNPDPYNPIVRFLRNMTEPVFWWVRSKLPFVVVGGFDLSPIVVILACQFLDFVLARILARMMLLAM